MPVETQTRLIMVDSAEGDKKEMLMKQQIRAT
jgi:hypothetical protein